MVQGKTVTTRMNFFSLRFIQAQFRWGLAECVWSTNYSGVLQWPPRARLGLHRLLPCFAEGLLRLSAVRLELEGVVLWLHTLASWSLAELTKVELCMHAGNCLSMYSTACSCSLRTSCCDSEASYSFPSRCCNRFPLYRTIIIIITSGNASIVGASLIRTIMYR